LSSSSFFSGAATGLALKPKEKPDVVDGVVEDPKTGFDEPKVLEAPKEKSDVLEAGVVLVLVTAGLKENGGGAESELVDLLEKEKGTAAADVVVLDGLEEAGLKLKVDVGVVADVLMLLRKLKDGFGASEGTTAGLVSAESPDLKFTNVDVVLLVRLDGASSFLAAFLAFLFASNSL